jgi:hypothetical protein
LHRKSPSFRHHFTCQDSRPGRSRSRRPQGAHIVPVSADGHHAEQDTYNNHAETNQGEIDGWRRGQGVTPDASAFVRG